MSLTASGRRFTGDTRFEYKIARADRLLGNRHLHGERKSIYKALCRLTLLRVREPRVIVDWTDRCIRCAHRSRSAGTRRRSTTKSIRRSVLARGHVSLADFR